MKTIEDRARELAKELGPLGSVTYAAKIEADRDRLREVNRELAKMLKRAADKLYAYHDQTGGKYAGGEALQFLMDDIVKTLKRAEEGK